MARCTRAISSSLSSLLSASSSPGSPFTDSSFALAIRLLSNGTVPLKIDEATRAKVVKCSESMWKLTYYAAVEALFSKLHTTNHGSWIEKDTLEAGQIKSCSFLHVPMWILSLQHCCPPYVGDSKEGFLSNDVPSCNYHCLDWELIYYKHHKEESTRIALRTLQGFSGWVFSFFRIGSVILALHDASDIVMEAAKVFKYSEKELVASVFFGFFAVSWLILRLVFFPLWIIKASSYNICEFLKLSEAYPTLLYYVFNTMLLMLLVFLIYWWVLICSMIQRQLKNRGKVGEDIRSDLEDDK